MSCSFITSFKKIRFRSPFKKNHKILLLKVKLLNGRNFFNNKSKKLWNKVCSQYPLCIIKFSFRAILGQKILPDFSNSRQIFGQNFLTQNQPKWKFYYAKWIWGTHFMKQNFLSYFVKKWSLWSKFTCSKKV